jgi:hypothetical protein
LSLSFQWLWSATKLSSILHKSPALLEQVPTTIAGVMSAGSIDAAILMEASGRPRGLAPPPPCGILDDEHRGKFEVVRSLVAARSRETAGAKTRGGPLCHSAPPNGHWCCLQHAGPKAARELRNRQLLTLQQGGSVSPRSVNSRPVVRPTCYTAYGSAEVAQSPSAPTNVHFAAQLAQT